MSATVVGLKITVYSREYKRLQIKKPSNELTTRWGQSMPNKRT